MLSALIDEARKSYFAAMKESVKKFKEYMSAPFDDDEEKEEERRQAMLDADNAEAKAEGVLEGLERAQAFLKKESAA